MCSGDRPTRSSSSRTRRLTWSRFPRLWMRKGSESISPTRLRGLSDAYGSWNTICSSRRTGRSSRRDSVEMSWPSNSPDALNYGWRDYGPRVGIWRMMESLDRHGVRASVLLNSMVAGRYPQIIKAGAERDWAWLAHGQTNSVLHAGLTRDEERRRLAEITDT